MVNKQKILKDNQKFTNWYIKKLDRANRNVLMNNDHFQTCMLVSILIRGSLFRTEENYLKLTFNSYINRLFKKKMKQMYDQYAKSL